ncbi:hypothetical protein BDK51DRAFT_26219, partial [Blyttiomyces helicus]
RLLDLFQDFPLRTEACDDYVRMCLKWSSKFGTCPTGDPVLHHAFGSRYYKEKQYYEAEYHFVYGTTDSAKAMGHMCWEWSGEGYYSDRGYFLLRAILPLLALKKIHHATLTFDTFTKRLSASAPAERSPSLAGVNGPEFPTFSSSLINFAQLLILVVQRDAPEAFIAIRGQYRRTIAFDPWLGQVLEIIAAKFFDLGPKKQANPFEDIMKSLFSGPPGGAGGSKASNSNLMLEMD